MKRIYVTLVCLLAGIMMAGAQDKKATPAPAASAAPSKPTPPPGPDPTLGEFKFVDSGDTHNFGEVPEGPAAEWDFVFTNVGKKPIIISEAHGSCGCTVPTWPKDTIQPGKKRFFGLLKPKAKKYKIHVTYNTNGRQGPIMKEVIITSNAKQQPMTLHIRGYVKPKAAVPAPENKAPANKTPDGNDSKVQPAQNRKAATSPAQDK
jgi:Protein of unknown function (DUF1573)